jgi:gliding motility-associated lipoprotein GldJ
MMKLSKVVLLLIITIAVSSCARQTRKVSYSVKTGTAYKKGKSPKTGMIYNDESNGGFMVNTNYKRKTPPGLIPIEGGTFVMGANAQNSMSYSGKITKKRVTVASFYMDETAVSNRDWLEYLHWIKTNYPEDRKMYYEALPDTTVWDRTSTANSQYSKIYLRHPAFQEYPVVGVSWVQANEYCKWRTDRVNEQILREKGILKEWKDIKESGAEGYVPFKTEDYLQGKYKGEQFDGKNMPKDYSLNAEADSRRTVGIEDGLLIQPYRLPTEAEWEYASVALLANQDGYLTQEKFNSRSENRSTKGLIMMNYKQGKGNNMGTAGYLNDGADITAPVRAYEPNAFGLYNMLGNVNEWVADAYQENTYNSTNDLSPAVGFGGESDLQAMAESLKPSYEEHLEQQSKENSESDLNDPIIDSLDAQLYGISTLISPKSRVVKGGSWDDRLQWVNPSARRFFNKESSSAMIGFRCAMTMTGSPEVISKNMKRASKKHYRSRLKRSK